MDLHTPLVPPSPAAPIGSPPIPKFTMAPPDSENDQRFPQIALLNYLLKATF